MKNNFLKTLVFNNRTSKGTQDSGVTGETKQINSVTVELANGANPAMLKP